MWYKFQVLYNPTPEMIRRTYEDLNRRTINVTFLWFCVNSNLKFGYLTYLPSLYDRLDVSTCDVVMPYEQIGPKTFLGYYLYVSFFLFFVNYCFGHWSFCSVFWPKIIKNYWYLLKVACHIMNFSTENIRSHMHTWPLIKQLGLGAAIG